MRVLGNFAAIQILREINFYEYGVSKSANTFESNLLYSVWAEIY